MKISKLLSIILGLSGFLRMGVTDGESGGSLGMYDAGSAFAALGDDEQGEEETEESAAERLAAEEAVGATQKTDDEPVEGAATTDGEKITIEVDGKTIELSKEDLPELYKNGLRQQDYTQKTMAAAEQRKAADAEIAKAREEREAYATKLNHFAITTGSLLEEQAKVLTQELLESDPVEYLRQDRIFKTRQAELGKAQVELQRLNGEYQQEQQQQYQQFMAAQQAALTEAGILDAKDAEKGKKFFASVESFMEKSGFKAEDGRMLLDARMLLMADKAMKYEALMAKVKEGQGKVKAAPVKVERPGVTQVAPTDGRTTAIKRLEKSGSVRDAAAIFANM